MTHGAILVTGGAGYIGSHTVLQLRARGERGSIVSLLGDRGERYAASLFDAPWLAEQEIDLDPALDALRERMER